MHRNLWTGSASDGVEEVILKDGLYRVKTPYLCAGFVVRNNRVVYCAPILRNRIHYWTTVAQRMDDDDDPNTYLADGPETDH